MLSVDSKLWALRVLNAAYAHVTQRASGVTRQVMRRALPSDSAIEQMTERQFDAACRKAFHGET